MIKQLLIPLAFLIVFSGCQSITTNDDDNDSVVRDNEGKIVSGTVKKYKNDVLHSVHNVKNYKLDGKSTIFQKDGKTIKSEINYKEGRKDGIVKSYYSNGSIYRTYNYKNGLMDGEQKRFRKNGNVSSIAFYKKGEPNNKLQEFLTNGKPKKSYPKIVITTKDKTLLNGKYQIKVRMSDGTKKVQYYLGTLDKDGFIDKDATRMGVKGEGNFKITYNLQPGQFIVEKLKIIAKVKTNQGNYYITTKSYNVAVENRFQ